MLHLKKLVLIDKLANTLGIVIFLGAALGIGFIVGQYGATAGIMLALLMIGVPVLCGIIGYPKFGITVLLIAAYLLMWVIRFGINFPLGTLMDALELLLIIGFFIKQKSAPDWSIYKNPISYLILAWIIFNLIEVANPSAESRLSWVYTIRSVAAVMLMYFVFLYHIKTIEFIRFILKLWLALSMFAALYGFKQEYFGFFEFEQAGLNTDLMRSLLFIGGHWRKFSIFSDPVSFAYNMVASSLLCIGLMSAPIKKYKKIILGCMAAFFLYAMLFSGTRGAYVLPPAAFALLSILKFNKKVLILAIAGLACMLVLIFMPTSNSTLYRFQSAFKPSEDESFNVRKNNQKRIQPYIQTHPIGGGLGATGVWGQRFAPYSYLANFPPDSGYVRVAVELGWIGLLLFCTLMFFVLKTGINSYYNIRDPELKSICLSMTLIIFALNIGNYPQEAFVQFPTNIFLYLAIALIGITSRLDKEKLHRNGRIYD
ncbi:MAG: O-antigen ligase family protein [Bacteroidota bacterium]